MTVTYVACLTPPGTAAMATLAVRGPGAWAVARQLFRPYSSVETELPAEVEAGRFWLGRMGEQVADQIVLALKRREPVPWVEIHCHGGQEVVRLLLETMESHGLNVLDWPEFERRTAENASQAAAAIALAAAPTVRTAAILLDQYHGAFCRSVAAVCAALNSGATAEAELLLGQLARHGKVGCHLTLPWRVVIAGAPNVGKSSLLNALVGYQRQVVSPIPGTTRDVVSTLIAVDGWPVELADTAGLREGAEDVEHEGILRARAAVAEADICLWLLDASAPPVWPERVGENMRLIVSKVDLPAAWDLGEAAATLHVSAKTGTGMAELCQALAAWLVPDPPPAGAAVPFTPELFARVQEAERLLAAGESTAAHAALEQLWQCEFREEKSA